MKPVRSLSQHSVRVVIATSLRQGDISLPRVASRLGVSTRSLQRHLAEMGTSYSEIVAEIRIEMACQLLVETDERILDIASRLGYAGASSFSRIFMRLIKTRPIVYRRLQRARRSRRHQR